MERTAESNSGLGRGAPTRKQPKQKRWISEGALEMIEQKHLAFLRWQEDRLNGEKCKECVDLCKKVWREVSGDKEKWMDELCRE